MASLALVTLDYPPEVGGVARYLGNLVRVADGQIDVFVPETHGTGGPGFVKTAHLLNTVWPAWYPSIWFIRSLRAYQWVLISHALPLGTAAWLARLFGGPRYAVLFHGLDLRLALRSAWKRWLLRRVLRGAGVVIANSSFTTQEINAFDQTIQPLVLTPGVEKILLPDRRVARQSLQIAEDDFIILSVTRLVPRKGIDRLIEALAQLPASVRLVVVGDGVDRERLDELVSRFGFQDSRRVTFIRHANDEERNVWYAAADVFALPARDEGRDVEGFGIVFLEAAQAGLPVVAGKSGGMPEAVIDEKTGLLVDSNQLEDVMRVLRRLIDDVEGRKALGAAGRQRVDRDFRWEDRWDVLKDKLGIQ